MSAWMHRFASILLVGGIVVASHGCSTRSSVEKEPPPQLDPAGSAESATAPGAAESEPRSPRPARGDDDPPPPDPDELDPQHLMLASACEAELRVEEGSGASVAMVQRWVCEEDAIHRDLDPRRGLFHVQVGESPQTGNVIRKAELLCGSESRSFASSFAESLVPKLLAHIEGGSSPQIRCTARSCELPGLVEYDDEIRLDFVEDDGALRLDAVVAIDVVLVADDVVAQRRRWAKTQLATRPSACP